MEPITKVAGHRRRLFGPKLALRLGFPTQYDSTLKKGRGTSFSRIQAGRLYAIRLRGREMVRSIAQRGENGPVPVWDSFPLTRISSVRTRAAAISRFLASIYRLT